MELRHLNYFLTVAEESSFTRAAVRLGIGQPPLSQQIKQLETMLGVTLFRRGSHGVTLTQAGEAFAPEARRTVEAAARAIHTAKRAANGDTGRISVGFTSSAVFNPVLPNAIRRFRRAYPDVIVTLVETNTMKLISDVHAGRLDTVFIRPSADEIEGLTLHRFPDEAMKIVIPSDHPLAAYPALPMTALAHEPFVIFPRAIGISLYDEVFNACIEAGFTPVFAQEAPQISSVINLVAAGLGLSIVPAAAATVRVDGVTYVDISGPAPKARLAVATLATGRSDSGNSGNSGNDGRRAGATSERSKEVDFAALPSVVRNFLALLPPATEPSDTP